MFRHARAEAIHMNAARTLRHAVPIAALCAAALAADIDELRVKRQEVFEFSEKPQAARRGDRVTIRFATKGSCDATVAIEDAGGRIVRHLASGVLGKNAPAPFQKHSLKQTLVWDGKDDRGRYTDDKVGLTVRVSLGLKPRFERTLFWSPKKRIAPGNRPLFAATSEGVYVFEGGGVDHIRLFDHDGSYVRTVYPFPPDRSLPGAARGPEALKAALSKVRGLTWMTFPQDGRVLPVWHGLVQATLFTSGSNTGHNSLAKYGCAASAFAVWRDRLALAMRSLNGRHAAGGADDLVRGAQGPRQAHHCRPPQRRVLARRPVALPGRLPRRRQVRLAARRGADGLLGRGAARGLPREDEGTGHRQRALPLSPVGGCRRARTPVCCGLHE